MIEARPSGKVARDLVTLARFIRTYCDGKHTDRTRQPVVLKFCDVEALLGKPLVLCEECSKLVAHAFVKRMHCPLDPKPACKYCPQHCYHPVYRQGIREVMRYTGWRMISRGRLDLLWHFIF